jgi:NAD(P)-dependent dehydrogenase (short-subunit alcohol dehydrogenase family)
MQKAALIVGAGSGISASFARVLAEAGYAVALASRSAGRHASEIAVQLRLECDASDPESVGRMFSRLDSDFPPLDVVLYNPSYRTRGALTELDPSEVRRSLEVTAFGAFLVGQQAAGRMLARRGGCILFTGASASIKGYARSAPFAMGKFALRGLAQSMARELAPQNIHVAHFVIDGAVGAVGAAGESGPGGPPDALLDPDAIARTYLHVVGQPRSAWTWEVELRPWLEKF